MAGAGKSAHCILYKFKLYNALTVIPNINRTLGQSIYRRETTGATMLRDLHCANALQKGNFRSDQHKRIYPVTLYLLLIRHRRIYLAISNWAYKFNCFTQAVLLSN